MKEEIKKCCYKPIKEKPLLEKLFLEQKLLQQKLLKLKLLEEKLLEEKLLELYKICNANCLMPTVIYAMCKISPTKFFSLVNYLFFTGNICSKIGQIVPHF